MSKFKVRRIVEGGCGAMLLGSSNLPIEKMEADINDMASKGYIVHFMITEQSRFMLFWKRESVVITYRKVSKASKPAS